MHGDIISWEWKITALKEESYLQDAKKEEVLMEKWAIIGYKRDELE